MLDQTFPTRARIAPGVDPTSDEYFEQMMEHLTSGVYHHAGTCKMGAEGDCTAVVDPNLR